MSKIQYVECNELSGIHVEDVKDGKLKYMYFISG